MKKYIKGFAHNFGIGFGWATVISGFIISTIGILSIAVLAIIKIAELLGYSL